MYFLFPLSRSEQFVEFSKGTRLLVTVIWFGFNPSHSCVKHNYSVSQSKSLQALKMLPQSPTDPQGCYRPAHLLGSLQCASSREVHILDI